MDAAHILDADVGVALGGAAVLMAKQLLNVTDVGTTLEQVRCKRMAQRMHADRLLDACEREGIFEDFLHASLC